MLYNAKVEVPITPESLFNLDGRTFRFSVAPLRENIFAPFLFITATRVSPAFFRHAI